MLRYFFIKVGLCIIGTLWCDSQKVIVILSSHMQAISSGHYVKKSKNLNRQERENEKDEKENNKECLTTLFPINLLNDCFSYHIFTILKRSFFLKNSPKRRK